ncbi:hypothetical protein [Clostridium uliginosum]|uniref:A49-like RNA polymerase I associated factor n=1 Tax=Clostridium uliginosum TaxID=119641 RepID=A0A1I1INE5_9CLOT|nr:hypothetical protein [Clostridium uliginosum]SFC37829.1 A49-like RNA polymerase I associated factor [Clostridium uliginosum]
MVRKKEKIKPVVPKPLNDTQKRNLVSSFVTNNITKDDTKTVTKKATKNVAVIKTLSLGKRDVIAKFTSTKRLRPNYNLSEDTIEKIEKISDILGYKKAEFVDIYLNGTLEKVLKDLEKNK